MIVELNEMRAFAGIPTLLDRSPAETQPLQVSVFARCDGRIDVQLCVPGDRRRTPDREGLARRDRRVSVRLERPVRNDTIFEAVPVVSLLPN
jgi:hypothetical protein